MHQSKSINYTPNDQRLAFGAKAVPCSLTWWGVAGLVQRQLAAVRFDHRPIRRFKKATRAVRRFRAQVHIIVIIIIITKNHLLLFICAPWALMSTTE
jgi:hypothetical protein